MKFPFYKQYDSTDCGPSCLRSITKYYGKNFTLQYIKDLCHIGIDGISLLGISEAAESVGFRTKMVKISLDNLVNSTILPCIIHWNNNHFVVLYKIIKRRNKIFFHISDPAKGLLKINQNSFKNQWTNSQLGYALLLETSPKFFEFCESYENKSHFDDNFLIRYLLPYKNSLVQVLLGIICGCILSLVLPFLTQSIVDIGIGNRDFNFITIILLGQLMIAFGEMFNKFITTWLLLHTTARISISLISDFLNKLTKLPIAFFDSKKIGDIFQRINDHQRIQNFLTGSLISILMATFIFLIYGFIMVKYNLLILLSFLLGSVAYIIWIMIFMKKRKNLDNLRFQESTVCQNKLLQLITGMQEIKINGCEKIKRWEWERTQVKLYGISIKNLSINQIQELGGTFIDQTKNVIITFISTYAVINGTMTLGMMMALQYIIGQMNAPIKQSIKFAEDFQDAKLSMDRLTEIHQKDDEEPINRKKEVNIPLNPIIMLEGVTFQYGDSHSDIVLKNINLKIPPGKVTAIVGSSGSGKSTLLKLILGFYKPTKGSLLLNEKHLHDYSDREWRKKCGVVMQEGFIFSDSIKNNIAVNDDNFDLEKVEEAAKIANLNDFIQSLVLGLDTIIGADGQLLSTGQKQRVLIARAVYKDAPILIFDEATNSLDATNEKKIMDNLNIFFKGRTVIIVAHRLSTVINADNIIVLNNSEIAEQGTHEKLIAQKGQYYELIKNQLELGN